MQNHESHNGKNSAKANLDASVITPTDGKATDIEINEPQIKTDFEQIFFKIFEISPIGITLIDEASLKYVNTNDSFLKMIGYKREEVIGRTSIEIKITDTAAREKMVAKMHKNGVLKNEELPFIKKSGEIIMMSFSTEMILLDGEPHRLTMLQDITEKKQAEQAQREDNDNFIFALNVSEIGSVKIDLTTYDIVCSLKHDQIFGYQTQRPKWTYDLYLNKHVHPEDRGFVKQALKHTRATGTDWHFEYRIIRQDGAIRWIGAHGQVIKDENGIATRMTGLVKDITEQKRKEQQIAQYAQNVIEASLDPLITINPEGKITDMNEAFIQATDKKREELINTDFFKYFTEPQKAREVCQEVFVKGFVKNYPLNIKDHKATDVLFNGSVYKDEHGKVLGAVVIARDITDQKLLAKELLEAKIKAEQAAQIAENAVKSKQQFLSNMSHEIRTPMNAIIGFTKVVLKTDLSAKQKEYLQAIKLSGDALIVLINDILDLAKVDAGKMTFEHTPFKLSQSIAAMLHLFEIKIQEKNLKLVTQYDPKIPEVLLGDPVRLHQIILNLVSNAVKFTSEGQITVSVDLQKEDEKQVFIAFSISDTGIGIAPEKIEKIFENFQQASSGTSRLYGGTGLGLAIVEQLIEAQGGKIDVKSTVNQGSTFSFVLNFQKTDAKIELEADSTALDKDIKHINVLVVEDIALNQLLMRTLLEDYGFGCDIADNGRIAIEKLSHRDSLGENNVYDIILMDLQMPEMNGFETTEYIRKTLKSKIPIIALTADVTTTDLEKCTAVGMNDYVAKPVDERLLYNKMVGLIKKMALIKTQEAFQKSQNKKTKCTDLDYLMRRTKSNSALMMQMIELYLEQTPPLIKVMKQSLQNQDWQSLRAAVHKMIPSFSIVGIHVDFENMARKVYDYALKQQMEDIHDLVAQLENVCTQACAELEEEFNTFKNTN